MGEPDAHNEWGAPSRWPDVYNPQVGNESAALLSELSEVLAICHLQLTRGETKTVQTELKRLSRALATSARDFRSVGDD